MAWRALRWRSVLFSASATCNGFDPGGLCREQMLALMSHSISPQQDHVAQTCCSSHCLTQFGDISLQATCRRYVSSPAMTTHHASHYRKDRASPACRGAPLCSSEPVDGYASAQRRPACSCCCGRTALGRTALCRDPAERQTISTHQCSCNTMQCIIMNDTARDQLMAQGVLQEAGNSHEAHDGNCMA